MAKTIGMLLDAFYPADIRVHKEAKALLEAGFKVALLCKKRKGEPAFENIDGLELMRINAGATNTAKGIMDIILSLNFVHPIFKVHLESFVKRFSVTFLHVHDLPLVKTALRYGSKNNVQVIADFHENYPEALNIWFQWKKNPLIRLKNKIFFGYQRWSNYEQWAVEHCDRLIVVVEEMKQRLVDQHNCEAGKILVITNSESKDFCESALNEQIYGEDSDKFILAYTGGVGPHRGVDTAIQAMSLLHELQDVVLYITGTSSKAANRMMSSMIEQYKLQDKVRVLGYRPFADFYSYMKMASVNIIPHHSNGHTDNTVPHKLFQCMMTGKPLLVSDAAPLKRLVQEAESGLIFNAGSPMDMAEKIRLLYQDRALGKKLGSNGFEQSTGGQLNWEHTAKSLVNFYSNFEDKAT